jgi:hypothetical protein
VLQAIAQVRPQKLFVIADGPRPDRPEEIEQCEKTRSLIRQIDWNCEVHKNFTEINQGIRRRIPSGLDWAFEQVNQAIILEDDCVPHPSFFRFCEELLERYRETPSIGQISGFHEVPADDQYSYHVSMYPRIWGWATWRRAWRRYNDDVGRWDALLKKEPGQWLLQKPRQLRYWRWIHQKVSEGKIQSWDYRWLFSLWHADMVAISPNTNLVRNVGLGHSDATHTRRKKPSMAVQAVGTSFPLRHLPNLRPDHALDALVENVSYRPSMVWEIKCLIKEFLWILHFLGSSKRVLRRLAHLRI